MLNFIQPATDNGCFWERDQGNLHFLYYIHLFFKYLLNT